MKFTGALLLAVAYFLFMALSGCAPADDVTYSHSTFTVHEVYEIDDNWSSVTLKDVASGFLYANQVVHCHYSKIASIPEGVSFVLVVENRNSWNKVIVQDICPLIDFLNQNKAGK